MPMRVIFVAASLLISATTQANLVVNGSFETVDNPSPGTYLQISTAPPNPIPMSLCNCLTGWEIVGNGVEWAHTSNLGIGNAADGSYYIDLTLWADIGAGIAGIKQDLSTVIGQTYNLTFSATSAMAHGRNGTGQVVVEVAGTSQTFDLDNNAVGLDWVEYSLNFTAIATTTTLQFTNTQNEHMNFSFIDNVDVVQAGPPYMLVSNWRTGDIVEYDASGTTIGLWANTGPECREPGPAFIAWGPDGNLYVTCILANTIRRYSETGVYLDDFVSYSLSQPEGVAFDDVGNLYVANFDAPGTVTRYDPAGNFIDVFASGLDGPREIAFDSQGNLYAAERSANRVRKISPDGTTLTVFAATGPGPYGLEIDESDNLYVTLEYASGIQYFDSAGVSLGVFGPTAGDHNTSLEFGPDGNLYVANSYTDVRSWQPDGTYNGVFAVSGTLGCCANGLAFFPADSDADEDGVQDDEDLCPATSAGDSVDANGCSDSQVDIDGDGVCDAGAAGTGPSGCTGFDNCPVDANSGQEDADTDGNGDVCDDDDDNDGVLDESDNCPLTLGGNPDQTDTDGDLAGDLCDDDLDGDGVDNDVDICPLDPDSDQTNTDGLSDGGDACDDDDDEDYVLDIDDNCDLNVNPDQEDLDDDGIGDACDADLDDDGVNNDDDNCPTTLGGNGDQTNTDGDLQGNVCDDDDDNDTVPDGVDNCPLAANTSQGDADGDGVGDVCNDADDADGDDWSDTLDNCPAVANGNQADFDGDQIGDACDPDDDGDGIADEADNCAATPLGETADATGCTVAQLCPCDGPSGTTTPWKNHGKYVSCVAHAANDFRDALLITDSEHGDIVSAAGMSACGVKTTH